MDYKPSVLLILSGLCVLSSGLPHQFHYISTALPWYQARAYCQHHFTDLATVADAEEMKLLVNTAQRATSPGVVWIGLYDNLTHWRWSLSERGLYTDQEGEYRNWGPDQPDNFSGDQLCAMMSSDGKWEDSDCSFRRRFVCYDGTKSADQQFIFVRKFLSWHQAQRYCRKHHTDLSRVRNKEENQKLKRLVRNRSSWIGLFRTREWSDHSESPYRNWKVRQPDNNRGQQRCTTSDLMLGGLWSDENCHVKLPFICHGEDSETTTIVPLSTTAGATPRAENISHVLTSAQPHQTADVASTKSSTKRTLTPERPDNSPETTLKHLGSLDQTTLTTVKSTTMRLHRRTRAPPTGEERTTAHMRTASHTHLARLNTSDKKDATLGLGSEVDQSRLSSHVVVLRVKLTSRLSEEKIQELVRVEIHNLLRAAGHFDSTKTVVRRR